MFLDLENGDDHKYDHLCSPGTWWCLCNHTKCTLKFVMTFRMYFHFDISFLYGMWPFMTLTCFLTLTIVTTMSMTICFGIVFYYACVIKLNVLLLFFSWCLECIFTLTLVVTRKCDLCHDLDMFLDLENGDNHKYDHLCWPGTWWCLCNHTKCTLTFVMMFRMYFHFDISCC